MRLGTWGIQTSLSTHCFLCWTRVSDAKDTTRCLSGRTFRTLHSASHGPILLCSISAHPSPRHFYLLHANGRLRVCVCALPHVLAEQHMGPATCTCCRAGCCRAYCSRCFRPTLGLRLCLQALACLQVPAASCAVLAGSVITDSDAVTTHSNGVITVTCCH